jgi:branched-subunit amino acid ABC-type transport system permease component
MSFATFLSNTLVIGLLEAAPLILAAIGFTLIFCLNGFINVAYAENLTLGAYLAIAFNSILGLNFYVSIIPSALLAGVFSVITYLAVFRPAMKRGVGKTEMIIISVGLSFFVRYGLRLIFGNDIYNFDFVSPAYLSVLGVGITSIQLICLGLVVVIALALYFFIYKTNYGVRMRAVADNEELAMISGLNPLMVSCLIWFLSGTAGGLAGIFFGVFSFVSFSLGWTLILVIIMVSIVGGIGSVRGALIAGAGAAIITTAVTLLSKPLYGNIALLVLFIVAIKFRKVRA